MPAISKETLEAMTEDALTTRTELRFRFYPLVKGGFIIRAYGTANAIEGTFSTRRPDFIAEFCAVFELDSDDYKGA